MKDRPSVTQCALSAQTCTLCAAFQHEAHPFGKVLHIDGHIALIPLCFGVGVHDALRPNDPVRILGVLARVKCVSGITNFYNHQQVPVPPLGHTPAVLPVPGIG